jgi:hypothetical protein
VTVQWLIPLYNRILPYEVRGSYASPRGKAISLKPRPCAITTASPSSVNDRARSLAAVRAIAG